MSAPLTRLAVQIGIGLLLLDDGEDVAPPEEGGAPPEPVEALARPPIVGRRYLVPCLVYDGTWVPVTGPRHADGDLKGGEEPHHHMDARFMPPAFIRRMLAAHEEHVLCALRPTDRAARCILFIVSTVRGEPELRPLLCLREQPLHPGSPPITDTVEARLGDKARLTPDGRCPHQGIPLLSQPLLPREDGLLVRTCPGHGAQFDEVGRLVRRCPRQG